MVMLNAKVIINILGLLSGINGLFMLLCIPVGLYYGDKSIISFVYSSVTCFVIAIVLMFFSRDHNKNLKKRDGYLIVSAGWAILALTGSLPFIISGSIPNYTDAFFETISGYTTTGATILTDIEILPYSILFWRSITHWIGGMGIIVLTIAILPLLGIGGMQLFVAESPGVSADKLHPRIKETAKRLWAIYVLLTVTETVLLYFGGMSWFDAVNHAMSTISTGGFSTKNASVAHYDSSFIQWVIIVFMFIAGVNFTMTYFALKGKFKKIRKNEELQFYAFLTVSVGLFVSLAVFVNNPTNFEQSLRDGFFQVVAILTTTGFVTADYTIWSHFVTVIFFWLMFMGASAGSTSGGVKIVRHIILLKNSVLELKKLIHPSAIIPVKLNGKSVNTEIVFNVLSFFLIYLIIFMTGAAFLASLGIDFETAIGASIGCLGNIGPGLGKVGPVYNYSFIPEVGKWFLSLLMLLGRLELFTVLILFTPFFWRKN
ncbi:MAG: TrkH family potassium uptake protein [Flavobacteriales bacterium]|nr:TrkH family potassium uptake protein [Flavobacteriales bacterium]